MKCLLQFLAGNLTPLPCLESKINDHDVDRSNNGQNLSNRVLGAIRPAAAAGFAQELDRPGALFLYLLPVAFTWCKNVACKVV